MTRKRGSAFIDLKFPDRLKQLLTENGITQQELADILGVQRQTVSLYVSGQIRPDIGALAVIAQHFCVSTDWLLGLTNDRNRSPVATDELGLSEQAVTKIKNYVKGRTFGRVRAFSSLDMIASHDDFEELLGSMDNAFSHCSEVLMAHSCGETEVAGEEAAIRAADELEGTRWTVVTSTHYARYLVYSAQQVFNRMISDLSKVEEVCEIMEY